MKLYNFLIIYIANSISTCYFIPEVKSKKRKKGRYAHTAERGFISINAENIRNGDL